MLKEGDAMAAGYCLYHQRYLDLKEIKFKRCRCKANTKQRCRHFISTLKQKYKNNSSLRR